MIKHYRSLVGISLNTHLQPLESVAADRIRLATNNSMWGLVSRLECTRQVAAGRTRILQSLHKYESLDPTPINDSIFPSTDKKLLDQRYEQRISIARKTLARYLQENVPDHAAKIHYMELGSLHGCRATTTTLLNLHSHAQAGGQVVSAPANVQSESDSHGNMTNDVVLDERQEVVVLLEPIKFIRATGINESGFLETLATKFRRHTVLAIHLPETVVTVNESGRLHPWMDALNQGYIVDKVLHTAPARPGSAILNKLFERICKKSKKRLSRHSQPANQSSVSIRASATNRQVLVIATRRYR